MFLPDRISEERMAAYREGVEKGRSAVRLPVLCRLVFSAKIPSGEALEMIGVPEREWEHYRRELKSIEKQRSNEKTAFLASYKYCAGKAGRKDVPWEEFAEEEQHGLDDLNTGDLAEILMMWMIGKFQQIDHHLSVITCPKLDADGIDLMLERSGGSSRLHLTFNRKNDRVYAPDIMVVELGASKTFSGKIYTDITMEGNRALFEVLSKSGHYSSAEIFDLFELAYPLEEELIEAWRWL